MIDRAKLCGLLALAAVATVGSGLPALAKSVDVRNKAELQRALQRAEPGTEIRLLPGVYEGSVAAAGLHGTADEPIVIRGLLASNPPVLRSGPVGLNLSAVSHFVLQDLIVERSSLNGVNIDDADQKDQPSHHVTLRRITVRDIGQNGNEDGFKLSGVVDFELSECRTERWGRGGQGMDLVGCRRGRIVDCRFDGGDRGSLGLQMKGGSQDIAVERCEFRRITDRCLQIGGSTGLEFFRPDPAGFEARDITVRDCQFCRGEAAIAFVNADGGVVERNVIYRPTKYVIRILQENYAAGFVPCRRGKFEENIVCWRTGELAAFANVSPGTEPSTFAVSRNYWYCENAPYASRPTGIPVPDRDSVVGQDPKLTAADQCDLRPLQTREALRRAADLHPSWLLWLPIILQRTGWIAAVGLAVMAALGIVWRWGANAPVGIRADARPVIHPALGRISAWLALATAALAVYGSLLPLQYLPQPFDATVERFYKTPYLTLDIYHLADWVANILLFIPTAYFAGAAVVLGCRWTFSKLVLALVVWVGCAALAVSIEFLQLWFPPRTVSQNDILAEWIGSGIGALAALCTAKAVGRWITRALSSVRPSQFFDYGLQLYAFVFVIYALMPLDLILSTETLVLKFREGRIRWFWPGAPTLTAEQVLELGCQIAVCIPLGVWIGRQGLQQRWPRSLGQTLVACWLASTLVELAQVFVFSRYAVLSSAIVAALAMTAGALAARQIGFRLDQYWTAAAAVRRRRWVAIAMTLYAALLIVILAHPSQLDSDMRASERLRGFWSPPFAVLYWGSEFHALTVTLSGMLLFAPLGFALADLSLAPTARVHHRGWLAAAFATLAVFATGVELSQAWLPGATVDLTNPLCFLAGAFGGFALRQFLHRTSLLDHAEPAPAVRGVWQPHRQWMAGFAISSAVGVFVAVTAARELAAWHDVAGVWPESEGPLDRATTGTASPAAMSDVFTPPLDIAHCRIRLESVQLSESGADCAIWGATGRDRRGRIWFGVSEFPSAKLMCFDPTRLRVREVGNVLAELGRYEAVRPQASQAKIHSRIVQGRDGFLYFTSMDEAGESEDGSTLPTWGSHLWRIAPDKPVFQHLAAVPEGLIALAAGGRWIYALGMFDHIVYQYDTASGDLRRTRVGSVGGHISRNLLADDRGHVFVPRLQLDNGAGVDAHAVPARGSSGVSVALVELDEVLRELTRWPLDSYLTADPWSNHGITGLCRLQGGAQLFVTATGSLYRLDRDTDLDGSRLTPLGFAHPDGEAYIASLFCIDGERTLLMLAHPPRADYEWLLYDLATQTRRTPPLEWPDDLTGQGTLLYGSMTRDDSGACYIAGTKSGKPLLLRATVGPAFGARYSLRP